MGIQRTYKCKVPLEVYAEVKKNGVCVVGETVYDVDEIVPAEQPCLKCRCQPPGVQCETVKCIKKPGCKAIHRPNRCCPDYQCECEHNGKIYGNGEKLETNPGGECKVCYCRGGELQCAEVSCYIRKDCDGKRVPGKCCPKFDHCPSIDTVPERPSFITESSAITPKSIIDLIDSINLINSTHPLMTTTSYSIIVDENKVPETDTSKSDFDEIKKSKEMLPKITIQEIIPERKEIPITAPPKLHETHGSFLIEESIAPNECMDDLDISDADPESSEIAEVFQHPPPVLRIGDKLLFLRKGEFVPEKDSSSTPESVITIIGAEGLQRGFEESFEIQDGKLATDNIDTNAADTNELELKTAESTHIISFVKRKEKTQVSNTSKKSNKTNKEYVTTTTTTRSVEIPIQKSEISNLTTEAIFNMSESLKTNDNTTLNVAHAPLPTSTEQTQIKITESIVEQNPAYPPIPDIMPAVGDVSQKFEVELESDNETMKILPDVFDLLENSTQFEIKNSSSYNEWLKTNRTTHKMFNNETLINYNALLTEKLLKVRAPIDIDDENSTEDIATSYPVKESVKELHISKLTGSLLVETSTKKISPTTEEFKLTDIDKLESTTKVPELVEKVKQSLIGRTTEETTIAQTVNASFKIKTELLTSIESLEREDSGELTTRKPDYLTVISLDENASVQTEKEKSEVSDMTQNASTESVEIFDETSLDKVEGTTTSLSSDVEMLVLVSSIPESDKDKSIPVTPISLSDVERITPIKESSYVKINVPASIPISDGQELLPKTPVSVSKVETISIIKEIAEKNLTVQEDPNTKVEGLLKPTQLTKIESSTYEFLPMPEHASAKIIKKREIGLNLEFESASIEVFPKPHVVDPNDANIQPKEGDKSKASNDPEDVEAQQIFKELVSELSTEQAIRQQRSQTGQHTLDGLSGALTSFALGGSTGIKSSHSNSGGVFQFISNIFLPNKGRK